MPRFSNEERRILIEVAETFADSTPDPKVRGHLRQAVRRLRESDKALTRRMEEQKGGKS